MNGDARPVQYFSDAYLERCRQLTPAQIVRFLDEFRRLHGARSGGRPGAAGSGQARPRR